MSYNSGVIVLLISNRARLIWNHLPDYSLNNIEGKITECWLVNEESIFLKICFVMRAKLLAHDWSSSCLATAFSIDKLCFCNNGVLFRDSWRGIYRRVKGQEQKWKDEEQHGVVKERFQKVGEWKKTLQANLEEYENDVLDQRSSQF